MVEMPGSANRGGKLYRQLLIAQFDAYLKIGVRKHGLSVDMFHAKASELSNEELSAAVTILRDLAHLPPE